MKHHLARWLPSVLMMVLIFAFSSIPSSEMPDFNWADLLVKKGGHMLGYALLAVALFRGIGEWTVKRDPGRWRAPDLWAWSLAVSYAISDEFHQSFVPGRNASPVDVLIDAIGAGIGLILLRWLIEARKKKQPGAD